MSFGTPEFAAAYGELFNAKKALEKELADKDHEIDLMCHNFGGLSEESDRLRSERDALWDEKQALLKMITELNVENRELKRQCGHFSDDTDQLPPYGQQIPQSEHATVQELKQKISVYEKVAYQNSLRIRQYLDYLKHEYDKVVKERDEMYKNMHI